jgi:hypothetical protein
MVAVRTGYSPKLPLSKGSFCFHTFFPFFKFILLVYSTSADSKSVRPGSARPWGWPKKTRVVQPYGAQSGTNSIYACHISQDHDVTGRNGMAEGGG